MLCYHHNDLDGKCAAAVVAYYFKHTNPDNYIESDYTGLKTELCRDNDEVFILDYSFTEDTVQDLLDICERARRVVWIDHHDSSIDLVHKHPELRDMRNLRIRLSKDQSGCYLTYQYFYKASQGEVPLFIQLVSDYDNWNHKNPGCTEFHTGMNFQDTSPTSEIYRTLFSDWDEYMQLVAEDDIPPLPQLEDIQISHMYNADCLLNMQAIWKQGYLLTAYQYEQNLLLRDDYGFESYLDNIKCFCVNAKGNSLIFGSKIEEYPICVTFIFDGEAYNYSVYSADKSISCKEIAERHGGGGHKGAAGFRSPDLLV